MAWSDPEAAGSPYKIFKIRIEWEDGFHTEGAASAERQTWESVRQDGGQQETQLA